MKRKKQTQKILKEALMALEALLHNASKLPKFREIQISLIEDNGESAGHLTIEKIKGQKGFERSFERLPISLEESESSDEFGNPHHKKVLLN